VIIIQQVNAKKHLAKNNNPVHICVTTVAHLTEVFNDVQAHVFPCSSSWLLCSQVPGAISSSLGSSTGVFDWIVYLHTEKIVDLLRC
jgi:hypothetical protein